MAIKILLADDDAGLRKVISFKLKRRGYDVTAVVDGTRALEALKLNQYDLLLSDMKMPGLTGIELLEQARQVQPRIEVILITAYAAVSQAVEAVKMGASDYLTKPFEDEQLFMAIEKALKFRRLEDENRALKTRLSRDISERLVGTSAPFRRTIEVVEKIAPTDATVLITGESGSGKEVFARLIHQKSNRAENEFVAVNCAAIPRELIESELFGHVRGAFTGAIKDKKGKFELANGGTLFLDEISELPIELQAKLLRVIQERVVEPVGSEKKIEIDIRLLAATNVNLRDRVTESLFREDLFYRLNVIPLEIPGLRERRNDIPILVRSFLDRFSPNQRIEVSTELLDLMSRHHWPGNIRELENLVERMVILRSSDKLTVSDLPQEFTAPPIELQGAPVEESRLGFHDAEKKLILDALNRCDWNKSKTAQSLKIARHVLIYRMKKYDLFHGTHGSIN